MKVRHVNLPLSFLLFLFVTGFSLAQQHQVSGTVTDKDGVPLPGVNVTVKETTSGTTTDFEGRYSIEAEQGQVLEFSFVGFESQERNVEENAEINLQMSEDSQALDEVVVTAFGREMTRNESTASVASISSEDLDKIIEADVREGLQGKVPGLVMNETSGTPGAEPEIRIRGQNSITADNNPLYVIDGVPVNSGNKTFVDSQGSTISILSLINPSDIENMTILKDASAVAPYGADAANGVILITTKKGKKGSLGEMEFNLKTSIGIRNDANKGPLPLNAQQRVDALEEAVWNTFGNGEFGNGQITSKDQIRGYIKENISDNLSKWEADGEPDYNWRDALSKKNAFMSNVNFSASKRSEDSNFYASLGFNNTKGTVLGTKMQRWAGSINYGTEFWDRFDLNISARVANADQDIIDEEAGSLATFSNPNYSKYTLSSWVTPYHKDGSLRLEDFQARTGKYNPFYIWKENYIWNNNVTRALQNTQLSVELIDDLYFKTVFGLDYSLIYYKNYSNPIHGSGLTPHGSDSEVAQRSFNYTTQNSLDYSFTLGEKNNFRITALQEFTKFKDNLLQGSGENFPNAELNNLSGTSSNWFANSTYTDQMKMRYVALLNYNFDVRYVLDASYSYQGDSRFSKRFDSFYSLGMAWNIDKEEFMDNVDFVNTLQFRIGYGITGNAGIDRNQFQELVNYDVYRNQAGAMIDSYGTEATWEKSERFDVGLEFELFNRKINGELSFYSNKTTDMLLMVPIPYTTGFPDGRNLQNTGEMSNRGIELEIGGYLIKNEDFNWHLKGSVSTLRNRVENIPEDGRITENTHVIHKGHKVNEWYMPDWAGVDPDNGLPLYYINKEESDATTTDYSEAERRYQGTNPLPTFYGSFSTSVEYKNVFLEASLYYSGGNEVYEFKKEFTQSTAGSNLATHNPSERTWTEAWMKPGDVANYPRWDYSDTRIVGSAQNHSTRFLHDDKFMRLRDIAVGYSFEKELIKKMGLEGLDISLRGKNLWTWVKDDSLEWDPEVRTDGILSMATPVVKSIVFNINLKF